MKSFKELREEKVKRMGAESVDEGAENYTVKKGPYSRKVDGKTADKMKRQGWKIVARESVDLEEGKMKEFHDYIDQGKSAQWIAKKMGLDMKTVKELMADMKESVQEVTEAKSSSDYSLYHKTYSGAMQAAYSHAKKKGYEVDKDDIDRKVASGPRKPSSGKTNSFTLKLVGEKKKMLAVQVTNLDNKRYELNCYIT